MGTPKKPMKQASKRRSGIDPAIGDAAVTRSTGRGWKAWFTRLDKAGGRRMDHKQLVAWVAEHDSDIGGWWTQMVVVTYEQKRGLRDKHEKPGGYEIGKSKTVPVPLSELYRAWSDKRRRRAWLGDDADFSVRKATREKSMRVTWTDGASHVDVYFWDKGATKSSVQVQHKKLTTAKAGERLKAYWGDALEALKAYLT